MGLHGYASGDGVTRRRPGRAASDMRRAGSGDPVRGRAGTGERQTRSYSVVSAATASSGDPVAGACGDPVMPALLPGER